MAVAGTGRPTLVVLRALGLGDLLTGVPALRALRRAHPDHHVVLAAPAALAPLVELVGVVDELVDHVGLDPLPARLSGADLVVNLHGRGPQSHHALLAVRPRRLVAFSHPEVPESTGAPAHDEDEHERERWCRLLREHAIPADPDDLDLPPLPRAWHRRPPARAARGACVVHPGAGRPDKRWPVERWAAVARVQAAAGRRVVITGSPAERALGEEVAERAGLPLAAVLAGGTDLADLAGAVAEADHVVCADTGLAHLATALRRPSVVLFGREHPAQWGPPPDRPRHRALWHADGPEGLTVPAVLAALADVRGEEPARLREAG